MWIFEISVPLGTPRLALIQTKNDHRWQEINFWKGQFLMSFYLIWPSHFCHIHLFTSPVNCFLWNTNQPPPLPTQRYWGGSLIHQNRLGQIGLILTDVYTFKDAFIAIGGRYRNIDIPFRWRHLDFFGCMNFVELVFLLYSLSHLDASSIWGNVFSSQLKLL